MESDHPEPVVRNWIAGFFIALSITVIPVAAVFTDRVKSSHQGEVPSLKVKNETTADNRQTKIQPPELA